MNYLNIGPLSLRVSRKHLAPWGYELIRIGGLSLFDRTSAGDLMLAGYHPAKSNTWHWSVTITKARGGARRAAPQFRRNQWHDYYWLPSGRHLVIGRQDYHLQGRA